MYLFLLMGDRSKLIMPVRVSLNNGAFLKQRAFLRKISRAIELNK